MDMLRVLYLARLGLSHEMSRAEIRLERSKCGIARRETQRQIESLWKESDELSQMTAAEMLKHIGGKSEIQS